jgi:hypothetical protein
LLSQAIAEGVAEDEHLDWKRDMPSDADEVAKDAAALANSGGGLLVYGVAEDRRTGRATASMHVDLAERHQRKICSWLSTRISPVIAGVEFVALGQPENDLEGFLIVSVPQSPDTPHLIGKDNSLAFPYRMGAQTFWMREWDLERAYRERFARRASDESRLADMIGHVGDQVDVQSGCWLIGAARPSVPAPTTAPLPDRAKAVRVIQRALDLGVSIAPTSERRAEVIRSLDNDALNPRPGLRRWVAATRAEQTPESRSDRVHIELHNDGSVVVATRLDGWYRESLEGKHCVPDFMVAGFAVDLVALLRAMSDSAVLTGQTLIRVDLVRSDPAPYALLAPEPHTSHLAQPTWTRDVHRFIPVETVAPQTNEIEQLRELAEAIVGDVVNQFGLAPRDIRW